VSAPTLQGGKAIPEPAAKATKNADTKIILSNAEAAWLVLHARTAYRLKDETVYLCVS